MNMFERLCTKILIDAIIRRKRGDMMKLDILQNIPMIEENKFTEKHLIKQMLLDGFGTDNMKKKILKKVNSFLNTDLTEITSSTIIVYSQICLLNGCGADGSIHIVSEIYKLFNEAYSKHPICMQEIFLQREDWLVEHNNNLSEQSLRNIENFEEINFRIFSHKILDDISEMVESMIQEYIYILLSAINIGNNFSDEKQKKYEGNSLGDNLSELIQKNKFFDDIFSINLNGEKLSFSTLRNIGKHSRNRKISDNNEIQVYSNGKYIVTFNREELINFYCYVNTIKNLLMITKKCFFTANEIEYSDIKDVKNTFEIDMEILIFYHLYINELELESYWNNNVLHITFRFLRLPNKKYILEKVIGSHLTVYRIFELSQLYKKQMDEIQFCYVFHEKELSGLERKITHCFWAENNQSPDYFLSKCVHENRFYSKQLDNILTKLNIKDFKKQD